MKKSNFLKKFLATTSVLAISATAGNALAADLKRNENDANVTLVNGAGTNVADKAGNASTFKNGDFFFWNNAGKTLNTGAAVTIGSIDLNNNAAGVFNVTHNTSLGSVVDSGGANTLGLNIGNGAKIILTGDAGQNAAGNPVAAGTYTGLGDFTLGNGSTLEVNAGIKLTSANVNGAADGQGSINFKGGSEVTTVDIGNVHSLKSVDLNGAGTVDFKALNSLNAEAVNLNHADAVVKFNNDGATITADLKTATSNTGKIDIAGNTILVGQIGTEEKHVKNVHFSTDKNLTLRKDDTKLYADTVTVATDNQTNIEVKSANFEIVADTKIGEANKKIHHFEIYSNVAGNAATTVKFGENASAYTNGINLAAANFNNVLELYDGAFLQGQVFTDNAAQGILSIKGDSKVDSNIAAGAHAINQVRFDAAKTLEVTENSVNAANGINFDADGTLILSENANFTLGHAVTTKVAETGTGSILINNATAGKTINLDAQIGDINAENTALKLLEAKGGADVQFSEDNIAIKKIDMTGSNSNLKLNKDGGNFLIGDLTHDNNKIGLIVEESGSLAKGSKLSTGENRLRSVEFADDKTLTLQEGVNLHTSSDANGGIRTGVAGEGVLVTEGNSVIDSVVGLNNAIGDINVTNTGKDDRVVASFLKDINLVAGGGNNGRLNIGAKAVAELKGKFNGVSIQGKNANEGTVRFANAEALTGDTNKFTKPIGDVNVLDTIEIAGANVDFTHADFKADNLKFDTASRESGTTISLSGIAANELQNTVITTTRTDRSDSIILNKDGGPTNYVFDEAVGTEDNPFGNITLGGDAVNDVTISNADFYSGVLTTKDGKGTATFNTNAGIALNIGSEGLSLLNVNVDANRTFKEDVWSRNVTVAANKTATFEKSVNGNNVIGLNAGSVATFTGATDLNIRVEAVADGNGTVNFENAANINKNIGANARKVNAVNFTGTKADHVVKLHADIHANDVVFGAQPVQLFDDTVTLDGRARFNGSTLSLEDKQLTLGGNSRFEGDATINTKLITSNANDIVGSIFLRDNAILNLNAANKLTINITDNELALSDEDEQYTLFDASAPGANITAIDAAKLHIDSDNRFVEFSMSNDGVLTRKNIAKAKLDALVPDDADNALKFVDARNAGAAKAYGIQLRSMSDEKAKESIARNTESTSSQAAAISSAVTSTATTMIDKRIGSMSGHPAAGIQLASDAVTGVAAGDDDRSRYGAWISPFYKKSTQKKKNGISGFETTVTGATIGFDTEVNADLSMGIAGTYAKSDTKHKDDKVNDKTKVDTYMVSVYGVQQLTNEWFLQAHGSYASSKAKSSENRTTMGDNEIATGKYDITSYGAELLAGFNYKMDNVAVTPLIGTGFTRINTSGYTQTGSSQNFTVNSKATNKLEAIAGLRAQMETDMDGMRIVPEMHGFVRHDFITKGGKTVLKLEGMADNIELNNSKIGKTMFNFGLGVNAVSGMYEFGAGYDLFAGDKYTGHQGTLKMRINF